MLPVLRAGLPHPSCGTVASHRWEEVPMVLAHAFGQRYELPLPLLFFVVGGAVVVFASFLLVLNRPVPAVEGAEPPDHVPSGRSRPVLAAAGVLLLVRLVVAGVGGSQEVAENIAPTAFWLVLWIAVPLSCGLAGDWTRPLNPFAALARLYDSDRARRVLLGSPDRVSWPAWLGWWPATVTFFLVACGELVYNQTATLPRVTGYGLLAAAMLSAAMGLLFGAEAWLGRGEMFSVLFATWGRLGYLRFGAPGRSGFFGGLDVPFEPVPSRLVFVLMLLVSVSFDGLISTPAWRGVHLRIDRLTGGSAVGDDTATMLVFLLLALAILVVFGLFAAAVARTGGRGGSPIVALSGLLPSLLPIAFGYLLAHNLQYLLVNGQLLIPLVGNPDGTAGGQWLPAPFDDSFEVRRSLLPPAFYWYVAVAVIIAVHVVAVFLAHRHLSESGAGTVRARRSEYPWLVAMVAYTMLSLWLLAQPLVQEKPSDQATGTTPVVVVRLR
jgi:hypothetical protein